MARIAPSLLALALIPIAPGLGDEPPATRPPAPLKPVASTGSGLLLDVPLDLSKFTRAQFEAYSATVGAEKIRRPWTSAILPLADSTPGRGDRPMTEAEIAALMLRVKDKFDAGESAPVSDVGLISTQEDVVRKPMYNHVAGFAEPSADAYLLVQSYAGSGSWGYFAIVQDQATDPPTNHFAEINGRSVKFEGHSCYRCHSSGPLAVHPVREDLVSDPALLAEINDHIASRPASVFHFPARDPAGDYGRPLTLPACARCHADDGDRAALYRVHAHPIRILVDFGHMPPGRRLKPAEIAELKAWLDGKAP